MTLAALTLAAATAEATYSVGDLKRCQTTAGGYAFANGGTAAFKVADANGPCEITYRFRVTERLQNKSGYALMLTLESGDTRALVSMRDAKVCESYFYRHGKKCGGPRYTGNAAHTDGAWHELKVSVLPKNLVVTLDGREIANGQHPGLCPVTSFSLRAYGVVAEVADLAHATVRLKQPKTVREPTLSLDDVPPEQSELALTNALSSQVGGLMFWARAKTKDGPLFSLKRGAKEVVRASLNQNPDARASIWVARTDDPRGLNYNRSYVGRSGDWVLVTLTWNADGEARYFINTLPYWVCFNPGQRSPAFLHADVDGIDRIAFPKGQARTCEIRRLRIFHRTLTNTEVWNEYRRFMPVDLVMNESVVDAEKPVEVAVQMAPGGYYTKPCPVQLDAFEEATVDVDLAVFDANGVRMTGASRHVAVNAPVDVHVPAFAYPKGNYRLQVTVNGFYTRTLGFTAYTSDYRPDVSDGDYVRGELIYERYPHADDADILRQGAVQMRHTAIGDYIEAGDDQTDRISFEVGFPADVSGEPVVLEIEWPDDRDRLAGFYMYAPCGANRDYLQQAISSGYEIPLSGKMQKQTALFWPGYTNYLFEARTLAPKMPAAVRALRVYRIKDGRLPANDVQTPDGLPGRHFGFYDEDQTFLNNLNAHAASKGAPCAARTNARFPCAVARQNFELFRYFDYIGMDTVSEPVWRYHITYFPLEGQTGNHLWPGGSLGWVWKECAKQNKRFIASLNYGNLPDVKFAEQIDGDYLAQGMEMLDRNGDPVPGYLEGKRTANPCHPKCVSLFLDYLRNPVRSYADSGLAGIQYEITTWGTWKSLENGYDDFTTGKFAKDTGLGVPAKLEDRYAELTGTKRAAWLTWRAEQVTALVRAVRGMLDEINPALVLELIVPADKEERYVQRGIDVEAIKRIPNVVFCVNRTPTQARHDMHWSREETTLNEDLYDFTKADVADLAVNGAVASVRSAYTYFETFVKSLKEKPYNCYFENADAKPWGRHYLREAAFSLAAYDMLEYTSGAQPLPSVAREAETREFAKAFRFLPAQPFLTVAGLRDPVTMRYLKTKNGTYWYAVNVFHAPVTVKADLGGLFRTELALKPYEVRSGLVRDRAVDVKGLELVSVDPEAVRFYERRLTDLEACAKSLSAAGIEVGEERALLARIRGLMKRNVWGEVYRLSYSRCMNQMLKKGDNIQNVLAEQDMAKTGGWRVNCGSNAYTTTPDGRLFIPDRRFDGRYGYVGTGDHHCASRDVTGIYGTDVPDVFKTEAYWLGTYRFRVPAGKYRVVIHMKYGFERGFQGENPLVSSVAVNGRTFWDKVDFRKAQGGDFRKACRLVADGIEPNARGEIEIEWHPGEKTHPSVPLANAIEVLPL